MTEYCSWELILQLSSCRVLIFLEAQALGRPLPSFALHMAQDLLAASRTLGLRALEVAVILSGVFTNTDCQGSRAVSGPRTHCS